MTCRLFIPTFQVSGATYQANKPGLIFFEFNDLADALEAVHRITVARDIVLADRMRRRDNDRSRRNPKLLNG